MDSESAMVAIEAALHSFESCPCGNGLDITSRDGELWLECRTFARPSRLPGRLARAFRDLAHERRFVIDEPQAVRPSGARA